MTETEAVQFLASRGIPIQRLQGGTLRYKSASAGAGPIAIEEQITQTIVEMGIREKFVSRFGFAVPTRYAIDAIARYQPILEVGAGSGYWAYELKKAGADIVATDPGRGPRWDPTWMKVYKLIGTAAIGRFPRRALLIVWPSQGVPWPVHNLRAFRGGTVIYVGEGFGGCTASDEFFEHLHYHFALEGTVSIPQFYGYHDRLEIWRR